MNFHFYFIIFRDFDFNKKHKWSLLQLDKIQNCANFKMSQMDKNLTWGSHYNITTSPHYNITKFQCHNITMSQHYNVTTLQCHNITMSQHYNVTTLQCHNITMSQHFIKATLQHHTITTSQHHTITTSQHYNVTILQCHKFTMSQLYNVTSSQTDKNVTWGLRRTSSCHCSSLPQRDSIGSTASSTATRTKTLETFFVPLTLVKHFIANFSNFIIFEEQQKLQFKHGIKSLFWMVLLNSKTAAKFSFPIRNGQQSKAVVLIKNSISKLKFDRQFSCQLNLINWEEKNWCHWCCVAIPYC